MGLDRVDTINIVDDAVTPAKVDETGYADSTNAGPPGGGVTEIDRHFREVGHCIQTVAAGGGGTHILARCVLHFN